MHAGGVGYLASLGFATWLVQVIGWPLAYASLVEELLQKLQTLSLSMSDAMLQFQDSADALISQFLANLASFHGADYGIVGFGEAYRTEYDVCTDLYATHCNLATFILLCDGTHLHIVGDDDILVAQFFAQFVLQDDARHRSRYVAACDGRCANMGGHD